MAAKGLMKILTTCAWGFSVNHGGDVWLDVKDRGKRTTGLSFLLLSWGRPVLGGIVES